MPIEFERSVDEARFKSPLEEFETVTEEIEHRSDPLTGRSVRVVPQAAPNPDPDVTPDLGELVGDGEECFFCPHNVEEVTPKYPAFVGTDRGSRGEATSFPNLFPYSKHSNVVALTEDHFRPMDELGAERIADGLRCALEYLTAVGEHDDPAFASANMNFLPPAGSSIVHPHVQAVADDHGTDRQATIARREREYEAEHGSRYYDDLLDRERGGDRYVGRTGAVEWIAPFAPLGQWHVTGVTEATGLLAPDDDAVGDFATGIAGVLEYYAELGLNAFNFGLRFARKTPASRVAVDVLARPVFDDRYINDAFYFQTVHDQRTIDVAPEAYASEVAAHLE
jgi:galactose-1-phosphate uridylyltransferase